MPRPGALTRVVLASHNEGKCQELRALLAGTCITLVPQAALGVPEVAETAPTFIENALAKARNCAAQTGLPSLADDSGLAIDALHGAPGIHSARYAGPDADSAANIRKLMQALEGLPDKARTARFHCVIVLLRHSNDPIPLIVQGTWEGRILTRPRGRSGFGYDPIFLVPEHGRSAAELPPETKNRISHRARAIAALRQALGADPSTLHAEP